MTTVQRIIKYCALALAAVICVGIIGSAVALLSGMSGLFVDDKDRGTGEMKTYAVTEDVKSLAVEINAARLEIKAGDRFEVQSDSKYITIDEKDGELSIREKSHRVRINSESYRVIITVPESFVFEKADIESGAGVVTIDALNSDRLYLDLGAGEVKIGYLSSKSKVKINGGAGKMTVDSGDLNNLDFDMGVGEVNLKSRIDGDSKIDCGIGTLNLTLTGKADDYRIEYENGIGSISIDGEKMQSDGVYGSGDSRLSIDGGIGAMNIRFESEAD